jgi:pilus assembly protein CpaE
MRNEEVLIIGPDASLRQGLGLLLKDVAKTVGEAPDFSSGYKLAASTNPDVIFIDLSHDHDRGLALIEKLAAGPAAPAMFVISKEKTPDLILQVMRLGVRDFFVLPDDEAAILRAMGSLAEAPTETGRWGRIVTVFSLLGGCGTTTLATNLAGCFALDTEKKSVLFDLDLYKGDVSFFLNIDTPFTITDFYRNLGRLDGELLNSSLAKHSSGLYVIGHPKSYEEIEDITGEHLTQVLKKLRQHYDFIVIDCIKAINDIFLAVMDASDVIVLVTVQTVPGLKNTKRCLELFGQLGYDREKIRVVLNRFTKKKLFTLDNVEKTLNWPVAATLTNLEQEAMEVMNAGRLLQDAFPRAKLTQEIFALGESLSEGAAMVTRRSGLFGFLRKGG